MGTCTVAPCRAKVFQSAPLTDVRGDRAIAALVAVQLGVSIRSPHGCKGRFNASLRLAVNLLFQSAPLTDVRGDGPAWSFGQFVLLFQSAPLTDVRGDRRAMTSFTLSIMFQSAPLTDVRGDCWCWLACWHFVYVSIRSPHGCKGR